MGCCKSRIKKTLKFFNRDIKNEFTDKRSQMKRVNEILSKIENEITKLKVGVSI
jgi:hypothetical protein